MRNRFKGICYQCGKEVNVGAGFFERYNGTWRVQHVDCRLKKLKSREAEGV